MRQNLSLQPNAAGLNNCETSDWGTAIAAKASHQTSFSGERCFRYGIAGAAGQVPTRGVIFADQNRDHALPGCWEYFREPNEVDMLAEDAETPKTGGGQHGRCQFASRSHGGETCSDVSPQRRDLQIRS